LGIVISVLIAFLHRPIEDCGFVAARPGVTD
jgi:hypothetical protein